MEKTNKERLELFWNNFLKSENEYDKQTYLELFLYELYKTYKRDGKVTIDDKNSLLASVSSQLSCHVLQMIYSTICTSINDERIKNCDSKSEYTDVCFENQLGEHFRKSLLKKSNEQKHITSLREFLLSGTGGRILETLQWLGLTNIPCGRELSNLLINLFPSASWNDADANDDNEIIDSINFFELLNKIVIYDAATIYSDHQRTLSMDESLMDGNSKCLRNCDDYDILNENICTDITNSNCTEYLTEDFKLYIKRKIPSKYFSKILINLLIAIAQNENLIIIDKSSSTIQSLNFALDKFKTLKCNPNIFSSSIDSETIRLKLLILFIISLNNILLNKKVSTNLIDVKYVLVKLVEILEHDILNPVINTSAGAPSVSAELQLFNLKRDIIFGSYYFIFVIINNALVLNVDLDYEYIVNLFDRFNNKSDLTKSIFTLCSTTNFQTKKIIKIIIKIIFNIKMLNSSETNSVRYHSKLNAGKISQNIYHYHHGVATSGNFYNLKCLLENQLLSLICYDNMPIDDIKLIIKYFQKYGFCCCNCNINTINSVFHLIGHHLKLLTILLAFLKTNIIKTMINTYCDLCFKKLQHQNINSNLIEKQLINNYINLAQHLNEHHIYVVLEHFMKLSMDGIPESWSQKIISQVTYPIFEKYCQVLIDSGESHSELGVAKHLIRLCLNVFSNYLDHNEKLIDVIFIDSTVRHLNNLIKYYEIVPNIFRLVKFGLGNFNVKNNTSDEIYKDLLLLPIKSTRNTTKYIIQIFNKLNKLSREPSNCDFELDTACEMDPGSDRDDKTINILHQFRLATVYWNMSLQLLQSHQEFKYEFNHFQHNTPLISLVYNILKFLLNLNSNNQLNNSNTIVTLRQMDETDFNRQIKNCDELYDIYNCKEYLYNFNSLLCINDVNVRLSFYQYLELTLFNTNFISNFGLCSIDASIESYDQTINYYELVTLNEDMNRDRVEDYDDDCHQYYTEEIDEEFYCDKKFNLISNYYETSETKNDINLQHNKSLIENIVISVSNIHKSLWNYFTSGNHHHTTIGRHNFENCTDVFSKEELSLLHSAECKKLCFQLFEIVLSVVLADVSDRKMLLLEEIKKMLIAHGNHTWDQLENGTTMLNVLQSLLRISKCHIEEKIILCDPDENEYAANKNGTADFQLSDMDHLSTYMDCSDDDNLSVENYITGDKGYEADAENCNLSETETLTEDMIKSKSLLQSTNFQPNLMHNGLCKLITNILFEFCNRCMDEPTFWPTILHPILTQLAGIRDSLGGSTYLLRGFHAILKISDNRLIDVQRSILELITDLSAPTALSEYLKLFTSTNPPTTLLLPRLAQLINPLQIKPAVEITFPCFTENSNIVWNVDNNPAGIEIKSIHDSHKSNQIRSVLTECKLIIPINNDDFNPWEESGFTVSTWIKCFDNETTRHAKHDVENEMVHLFSLGSKKLLLSAYLNSSNVENTISIQVTRPDEEISESSLKHNISTDLDPPPTNNTTTNLEGINVNGKKKRFRKLKSTTLNQGLNIILDSRNGNFQADGQCDMANGRKNSMKSNDSKIIDTFKNTKTLLKSSLINFQLFSSAKATKQAKICFQEIKPVQVQHIKLPRNKWTHLSFSVEIHEAGITLLITMDGTEKERLKLYLHQEFLQTIRKHKSTILCIGSNNLNLESSNGRTLAGTAQCGYKFSNLILFRERIQNFSVLATLTALGPDFVNFNYTMAGDIIPNINFLNNSKAVEPFDLNAHDSIKILQNLLIGIYSAHTPNKFLVFDFNKSDRGKLTRFISFDSAMSPTFLSSLQNATILCGGVPSIIILFGRVVELSNCPITQAQALQLVLKIIFSQVELYSEFCKCGGITMIGSIIRTKNCIKSIELLKVIVEIACEGAILSKKSQNDNYQIISQTIASIVHPELLISIIRRYWDWYDPQAKNSNVLDVLFGILLALVREKHPHHSINVYRLAKAGIIPTLLNFCKIYLVGASRSIFISKYSAENLVNLVRVFAGAPPLPSLLDDIIKLLILMHRPSDSFVTHDRSKFYFLLTPLAPQKRLNLPQVQSKINSNYRPSPKHMKRERVIKFPISVHSMMRSKSFDFGTMYNDESWSTFTNISLVNICEGEVSPIETNESQTIFRPSKEVELYQCSYKKEVIRKLYWQQHKKIKKIIHKKIAPSHKLLKPHRNKKKTVFGKTRKPLLRNNSSEPQTAVKILKTECQLDKMILNELPNSNDLFKAYKSPGFIRVQECFFNLLRDFILILPDNSIDEVLNHYVTIEILIVLSNHSDVNIRTAIVNLLSIICHRLPSILLAQHAKLYSWFHLGNQVSLNHVDGKFLNACIQFITGNCFNYEEMKKLDEIHIRQKGGLNLLIAALSQTVHDQELAIKAFNVVDILYTKSPGSTYMIENGLVYALVKTLIKTYTDVQCGTHTVTIERIVTLLTKITFHAFTSSGTMPVLWDILNCLTFVEQAKLDCVRTGARTTQAKILNFIVDSCVPHSNQTSTLNFKIKNSKIIIPNCSLSTTELKTRFDLMLDRSVQFITNSELTYQPTDNEIKLIFAIIDLTLNGHARCYNNLIVWALCPSRPISLVVPIIRMLSKIKNLNKLSCDLKVIKIFSQSFVLANRNILHENDLKVITDFNNSLEGPVNISWNLQQILDHLEFTREMSVKELKPSTDKVLFKMESIAQICIDSAMNITRNVVELQNVERRFLMSHMRSDDDKETIMKWHMTIQNMTHEGAPWYSSDTFPNSWELDHTEGPSRILLRFKRCHPNIENKFLLADFQPTNPNTNSKLLQYLMTSINEQCNFCANDQVLYNFNVKHLLVDSEMDGELIVTESQIIFMPNRNVNEPILYDIISITDIWTRRYQHNDVALEFFLDTGNTMFIIMNSSSDRETLEKYFSDKLVPSSDFQQKLSGVTQQWKEGQLTNWEYLTILNQMSGRTYHDLMQYPVFPWILSDYENTVLDLTSSNSFRMLNKPIAIQHNENEAHYITNYEYLSHHSPAGTSHLEPYHYGSHYSNSGTVLHFLVRLFPFTRLFLHYQDNNFDIPDRTFHSVKTTWRLASKDSPTDVKELIPHFYSLAEMFENNEGFNFGTRQSGEAVNNVILPPWCDNSPRLFTLIHRQALEVDMVRNNLNHWIDLIFGYKQDGQPAIDAINVFHPATYYGFSCQNMSDPVEKMACETMVRTYGQMPRKLFKSPHPNSQMTANNDNADEIPVLRTVKGLKWGEYTGSPCLPNPVLNSVIQECNEFSSFFSLENTNVIYNVPEKCNIMQGVEHDTMNLISWNEDDNVVRIKPIIDSNIKPKILINITRLDPITACGTNINSNQLWFGHKSGRITVYYCTVNNSKYNKNRLFQHANFTKLSYNSAFRKVSGKLISRPLESEIINGTGSNDQNSKWHGPFSLICHTDQINVIKISVEFKIAVSASRDGLAVIWDINRLQYIRIIETPSCLNASEIYLTEISSTLGDIITIYDVRKPAGQQHVDNEEEDESFEVTETNIDDFIKISMNLSGNCIMRLHTVNGKYVNHVLLQEKILSLCCSHIKEGTGVNVVLTGMEKGIIKFWSSWNLCFIKEIYTGPFDVISLTYSAYQYLVILHDSNMIQVWESPGLNGPSPKLYILKDGKHILTSL